MFESTTPKKKGPKHLNRLHVDGKLRAHIRGMPNGPHGRTDVYMDRRLYIDSAQRGAGMYPSTRHV
jgi:hypothetical protein